MIHSNTTSALVWTSHSLLSWLISSRFLNFLCAASRWIGVWVKARVLSVLSERTASWLLQSQRLLSSFRPNSLYAAGEYSVSLRWSVGFRRVSSTDVLCLCGGIRLTPNADIMCAARSINCGSVLRHSERGRERAMWQESLISHKSQRDSKQKQTETIPSLLRALVQITSWRFARISITSPLLLPPTRSCIWRMQADIYIHNKQCIQERMI